MTITKRPIILLSAISPARIREGMGLCVDMMNEFECGCEQDQCTKPLMKYGGAAKEVIPRLRETIAATRKAIEVEPWNGEGWKKDTEELPFTEVKIGRS